jgi:hypothetical protein
MRLDGLNVLTVAQFDGNIWAGEARLTLGLYIDAQADERQRDALQQVFSGQAGGFMATMAELVGEVRGLEFVPITFEVADDLAYWRAEVPGKVVAAAEALSGPTTPPGARVQLLETPPGSKAGPRTGDLGQGHTANQVGCPWVPVELGRSSKHIPRIDRPCLRSLFGRPQRERNVAPQPNKPPAADALQPPLRFRFWQRLRRAAFGPLREDSREQ